MRNLIFFILVTLSLATHSASAAENRVVLPDGAVAVLALGERVTGNLPADDRTGDSASHCYVFAIEPGGIATINLRSTAFDTELVVLAGSQCEGRSFYSNDDVGPAVSNSALIFEAVTGRYSILVQSRSRGGNGAYQLIADEADSREFDLARVPWSVSAPEAIVRSLYADPAYRISDRAAFYDNFVPTVRQDFETLDARTDGYGLGFDFLVDGQDADLSGFGMSLIAWAADEPANLAIVDVRFRNFDEPVHLVFQLRELASGWRIEDVQSRTAQGAANWVLSETLEQELAATTAPE